MISPLLSLGANQTRKLLEVTVADRTITAFHLDELTSNKIWMLFHGLKNLSHIKTGVSIMSCTTDSSLVNSAPHYQSYHQITYDTFCCFWWSQDDFVVAMQFVDGAANLLFGQNPKIKPKKTIIEKLVFLLTIKYIVFTLTYTPNEDEMKRGGVILSLTRSQYEPSLLAFQDNGYWHRNWQLQ